MANPWVVKYKYRKWCRCKGSDWKLLLSPGVGTGEGDGDPWRPPAKALRTHSSSPKGGVGNGSYLWAWMKLFSKQGARHSCVLNTYEVVVLPRFLDFVCHTTTSTCGICPLLGLCPAHVQNLFEVSSGVTEEVTFYIFIVWICHFKLKLCQRRYEWHEGKGL